MKSKDCAPQKRSLNMYYKPDRTTKPATIALYVLFVFVCLLGLSKVFVYDLWSKTNQSRQRLAAQQAQVELYSDKLKNYKEIQERYWKYSATDEEREMINRLEILALLDEVVGKKATIHSIVINGDTVQLQFSGVTLEETADIMEQLGTAGMVAETTVNTAATSGYDSIVYAEGNAIVQANAVIRLQKEVSE